MAALDSWVRIGPLDLFSPGKAMPFQIQERQVILIRLPESLPKSRRGIKVDSSPWVASGPEVIAMDRLCYHAGGDLAEGDIEDLASRAVLRCPVHGFAFDLESGEQLLQERSGRVVGAGVECRQRIHQTRVQEEHVWVCLNKSSEEYASDQWQTSKRGWTA
jgi:nitrite reductase/ring-hydroxylating ferredoxin subunit